MKRIVICFDGAWNKPPSRRIIMDCRAGLNFKQLDGKKLF